MIDPNAKLDPESARQLREIALRTDLDELKKRCDTLSTLNDGLNGLIRALDLRVSNLEHGRREQIILNQQLLDKTKPAVIPKKSLWDWLK